MRPNSYLSVFKLLLTLRTSPSAVAPSSPILVSESLQSRLKGKNETLCLSCSISNSAVMTRGVNDTGMKKSFFLVRTKLKPHTSDSNKHASQYGG